MTWRARKGFSPRPTKNASSSGRASPSRLTRAISGADMGGRASAHSARARTNLGIAEEERNLARCRFRRIRAVHHVFLDARGKIGANGSGGRLLRIGGTHDVAVARHGVVAFQDLY